MQEKKPAWMEIFSWSSFQKITCIDAFKISFLHVKKLLLLLLQLHHLTELVAMNLSSRQFNLGHTSLILSTKKILKSFCIVATGKLSCMSRVWTCCSSSFRACLQRKLYPTYSLKFKMPLGRYSDVDPYECKPLVKFNCLRVIGSIAYFFLF